ncbi:hypothetical protein AB6A40_009552 [Gnathostoma spinigerum]|uniref:Uncharacterized protein n=1 Tax=Gnathostoma spinigerum TaxID=75299 RepID=A0ABD6F047_9BILA
MAKLLGDYFKTRGLSSHTELFGTCDHSHIATINSNSAVDSVNSIAVQNSANFSPKGRAGSTTGSSKDLLAAPKFDISIWRMVAYGVGHFYNDLCASMWFTYLMIFLQNVLTFPGTLAGTLMFIGQIVDAISTPCVGLASDGSILPPLLRRLGRRTGWHVIGVIFITLSFPFVFNTCLPCASDSSYGWIFAWFVPFVVLFQVGWASVQVSHLALIPELSKNNNCRTAMSSLRFEDYRK